VSLQPSPPAADPEPALAPIARDKLRIAGELAAQAAYASARRDSEHAVFCGCIDWHSAVHGLWALLAYQNMTGDVRYAGFVDRKLEPKGLAAERDLLHRYPQFEMPYGRAWFLRLAIEHHAATGGEALLEIGDGVARSLRDYCLEGELDPASGSYGSASWALANLIDYARHRRDGALERAAEALILDRFVKHGPRCSVAAEAGEFMAVATNWAALVGRVLDGAEYSAWLDEFVAANGLPQPVRSPRALRHFGLNFSRAWGLWRIYERTGRAEFAAAYAEHFESGFTPRENWRGSYEAVGHWVAQFGMLALQPLFWPPATKGAMPLRTP
jgi:hypothetical protein